MKKHLFWLAGVVLSSAMLSCSSSNEDEIVDLGEAKTVVNMLSEAQPIELTKSQRVFANDNNQFTLNFLANRPFVYFIAEASSGVILFVGKFTGV